MTDQNQGVGRSTPTEAEARRRYIRGELDKAAPVHPWHTKLKLRSTEGESFWLNITAEQQAAIEKILLPDPADNVSYSPCLKGKVLVDGAVSEFMIPLENDSVGFSQWGAPDEVLWQRVPLLHNLSFPAREWWAANKPEEDHDD